MLFIASGGGREICSLPMRMALQKVIEKHSLSKYLIKNNSTVYAKYVHRQIATISAKSLGTPALFCCSSSTTPLPLKTVLFYIVLIGIERVAMLAGTFLASKHLIQHCF